MRKLATIREIQEIRPIPDASAICAYRVDNWLVVDSIGKYAVGEIVVYCEPDSWIPHDLAPFLSKGQEPREYDGIKGERLRTVKLRGQLSQGLLFKLESLPDDCFRNIYERFDIQCAKIGVDVSDILGIVKYEPPVPAQLAGIVKGPFPSCFPKTDEERIQNLTDEYSALQEYEYEETEKLEGSSMSVGLVPVGYGFEFIVCSRNLNLKETEDNTLWKVARKYDIERKLLGVPMVDGIIIQGELIGEGIQGNYYGIKGHDFYVFAIYDVGRGKYYTPSQRRKLCEELGLKHTPVLSTNRSLKGMTIDDVLLAADGKSQINPAKLREGVVYKRADGSNGQEHFKAVSNEYLLKTGG